MSNPLALLPAGLRDLLPPESTQEAGMLHRLVGLIASHGYDLVKPPLVEFEETLLSGSGQSLSRQTFRLMDPLSQQMMALRADTTLQIARIAGSRLRNEPRPLRLAYCGEVLRVSGTQLFPERQFCQLGCELIGVDSAAADGEMILLAAECMEAVGIRNVSIDISLPAFIPKLLEIFEITPSETVPLSEAIERRDLTAIRRLSKTLAPLLEKIIGVSGPIEQAIQGMQAIGLPSPIQPQLERLRRTVEFIHGENSHITLTLDPLERRGFEYHTALSFTVFVRGHGEVGRGGRYLAGNRATGEPATGFTYLSDNLLAALPPLERQDRVYLSRDTPADTARQLREEGMQTVRAMTKDADIEKEARRMKCTHYWDDGYLRHIEGS